MKLFNPSEATFDHLDEASRVIMRKTIDFFENKGKNSIKHDDQERVWYADFLDFLGENHILYHLLTPPSHGDSLCRWDTCRNCDFNEILGFYGLPYCYTWQVTILCLGPLWISCNETVKEKTAALLRNGGIFAFGLSEKAHGADLYSTEMALTEMGNGQYRADGGKYYIGNANKAALVSTFGKFSDSEEYVFFAVESGHPSYECVKNVVNSQNYVAEYMLHGYPVTDADILSRGRDAWDSALNTINVGKFNLGWASIGICTHAFYEAIRHASHRILYGKPVTDFPHVRQLFVDAYSRLSAMRLFSLRASDYMRSASESDRRYLLYNPLVKMKVTTQGEEVINLMWDVIAAKGFEKDTYFEMAARDIRALPKLEGTVHVNMALIVKFMANYFFNPDHFPEIIRKNDPTHDEFLFRQGPTRGLGSIRFHDFMPAYRSMDTPNIRIFREQIEVLRSFLMTATPDPKQIRDIDFLLNLGELFTLVAYGQLILESVPIHGSSTELVDQIFDFMVRDFSRFALQIYSKPSSTALQMSLCMEMIRKPAVDQARFEKVWAEEVYPLKDAYEMKP